MPTTSLFQEWFYWLFEINTFRHLLTAYFCRNCGRNASVLKSFLCSVSNVFLVLKAFITIWAMLYFVFMRWQMPFWTVIVFEFTFVHIYNSYYQPLMLKPWMVWECTWSVVCSSTLGTEDFLALYEHVLYEDSSYVP